MKYSEFEDIMDHYGYIVENKTYGLYVRKIQGNILVCIDKEGNHAICTDYVDFLELPNNEKDFLLDIFVELAKTPLAEREEEKRYWLRKIPVPLLDKNGEKKWLWKYTGTALSKVFGADTIKVDSKLYQTIFTESEISQMDIAGFEKVEVEE